MTQQNTKTVRIRLAALTRVEYTEVLEVPADLSDMDLLDLVEQRYDELDGSVYTDDADYWEKGSCGFYLLSDNESVSPNYVVTHGNPDTHGDFIVEEKVSN